MEQKPLTANAADPAAVGAAKKQERISREDELNDWRQTFDTPHGRRVLDRILSDWCKTYESIWAQSAAIHYNAGQQDIGHRLMAETVQADEMILFKIMQEKKKGLKNG